MDLVRKYKTRQIVSACLLLLFVAFQASVTLFPHTHFLGSEKLVHSHPYSNANHCHSGNQILSLDKLSAFQSLEAPTLSFEELALTVVRDIEFEPQDRACESEYLSQARLRAPPVC